MSEAEDPSRLADDASMPDGLRDALRGARADVGSEAQLARLATRLGPLLGAPIAPGSVASGQASAGVAGSTKLALGALALIVAGGAAWLLAPAAVEPPPAPTSPPIAAPPPEPAATVTPPQAPVPASAPAAESAPAPSAAPLPAKPVAPALSEAELLEQARAALRSDPARALLRANEHRARFGRGVLVQEREVIAIQALRQLGRSVEADKRADAFAKAFPGSAFQRKLKPAP